MQASWAPMSAPPTASSQQRQRIRVANLHPIKRKLDRIETERIYRVLQTVLRHVEQVQALEWLIEDDSHMFRITDHELRQLVMNHQFFARPLSQPQDGNQQKDQDVTIIDEQKLKESTRLILRYAKSPFFSLRFITTNTVNIYPKNEWLFLWEPF